MSHPDPPLPPTRGSLPRPDRSDLQRAVEMVLEAPFPIQRGRRVVHGTGPRPIAPARWMPAAPPSPTKGTP